MTLDQIFAIAKSKGSFETSLRYRDERVRSQCHKLLKMGLLYLKSRRASDASSYYLTDIGKRTGSLKAFLESHEG
jgi:hypothetical protein